MVRSDQHWQYESVEVSILFCKIVHRDLFVKNYQWSSKSLEISRGKTTSEKSREEEINGCHIINARNFIHASAHNSV